MEQSNESQKKTEQLYSNVEETYLEINKKIDIEPTYSLEDLHPEIKEEEKPAVFEPSETEEIQPDPTIIDGKKEIIGDQSAIMEATLERQNVQPLETPQTNLVQMAIPQQLPQIPKQTMQNQPPDEPNAKLFYAVFAIILLIVLVGFPLSTVIQNNFESKTGAGEPIKNQEEKKKPETEDPSPTEPDSLQINQISFNMDLKFDKGFVTNEKEINQKEGYLPTNLNGVIRCDLEKPLVTEEVTTYASTYLHYENFKLRSAITVTKQVYKDNNIYMNNKDATQVYKTAADKKETLDVEIKQDDVNFTVTNIMHYHLMYGHSTHIEELDKDITFSSIYSTNIKNAIDNTIKSGMNNGIIICGTLNTENINS